MGETIERGGAYWHQRTEDGTWFRWDEASRSWLPQGDGPPPESTAQVGQPSGAPPAALGYDYTHDVQGVWWARDRGTGVLYFYDAAAASWVRHRTPPTELKRPGFPYAGFWERFGAFLVDATLTGGVGYGIGWLLGMIMLDPGATPEEVEAAFGVAQLLGIMTGWLYFAVMESSRLQATLGKKMVGLQVTDDAGRRIGFGKATGRHFSKFLSAVILGLGFLMIAWDDKKRGLHDRAAGTLVLKRSLNTLRPQLPATET